MRRASPSAASTTSKSALAAGSNVANYKSSEHRFVQQRLNGSAKVLSWRRVGADGYELVRVGALSDLSFVTIQSYELPSHGVYELPAQYNELALAVIVPTNSRRARWTRSPTPAPGS